MVVICPEGDLQRAEVFHEERQSSHDVTECHFQSAGTSVGDAGRGLDVRIGVTVAVAGRCGDPAADHLLVRAFEAVRPRRGGDGDRAAGGGEADRLGKHGGVGAAEGSHGHLVGGARSQARQRQGVAGRGLVIRTLVGGDGDAVGIAIAGPGDSSVVLTDIADDKIHRRVTGDGAELDIIDSGRRVAVIAGVSPMEHQTISAVAVAHACELVCGDQHLLVLPGALL